MVNEVRAPGTLAPSEIEVNRGFDLVRAATAPHGGLMYAKLWGSWSHNAALPESDYDFLAVYVAPTALVLSMRRDEGKLPYAESVDGRAPDFEAHEVGHFAELLLKGNPAVIEMLFTERYQMALHGGQAADNLGHQWNALREARRLFLTRKTVQQYLGYAQGQLARLKAERPLHTSGGAYNTKWAYHIVRLVLDADRIANGQEPQVWREDDSPERRLLLEVRAGRRSREFIAGFLAEAIRQITKDAEVLPLDNPREWLNRWLLWVRGWRTQPPLTEPR